ncbi:hypothetical protein [Klebsiella aerogenes]|uniref:hypothetical protein n=1 Tax=Klebsiella aerogenes TaxID=548 RepID=UPI001868BF9E|nr:hypothetical protein [Klebsiella aerogenes]
MHSIQFAQSLIRTCAFTYRQAANRLTVNEFREDQLYGISLAWTLLHLTGQLEWAVKQTNAQGSIHDVAILEQVKGATSDTSARTVVALVPDNGEIMRMFEESVERALSVLDSANPRWLELPNDASALTAFPSVAAVWKHVAFHMSWHLGQLATVYPQLVGPLYSEPPLYDYTGNLD